jgi:hypothetical protein
MADRTLVIVITIRRMLASDFGPEHAPESRRARPGKIQ